MQLVQSWVMGLYFISSYFFNQCVIFKFFCFSLGVLLMRKITWPLEKIHVHEETQKFLEWLKHRELPKIVSFTESYVFAFCGPNWMRQ